MKHKKEISRYLKKYGFEKFELKAVLFDMDGVLFDSMPYHARAWEDVCHKYGMPISSEEPYMHEGRTGADTVDIFARRFWGRCATEQEKSDIYAIKCQIFNSFPEPKRMPGAEILLEKLRKDGVTIAVVTGSGQESLLTRLNNGYNGFFKKELIVSSHDTQCGKPAPDPYLKGLEKCGVEPYEAVVIENAPLGVRAAVAAKIFTIAVNTGPLNAETLYAEGADVVFPSMPALANAWPLF